MLMLEYFTCCASPLPPYFHFSVSSPVLFLQLLSRWFFPPLTLACRFDWSTAIVRTYSLHSVPQGIKMILSLGSCPLSSAPLYLFICVALCFMLLCVLSSGCLNFPSFHGFVSMRCSDLFLTWTPLCLKSFCLFVLFSCLNMIKIAWWWQYTLCCTSLGLAEVWLKSVLRVKHHWNILSVKFQLVLRCVMLSHRSDARTGPINCSHIQIVFRSLLDIFMMLLRALVCISNRFSFLVAFCLPLQSFFLSFFYFHRVCVCVSHLSSY